MPDNSVNIIPRCMRHVLRDSRRTDKILREMSIKLKVPEDKVLEAVVKLMDRIDTLKAGGVL